MILCPTKTLIGLFHKLPKLCLRGNFIGLIKLKMGKVVKILAMHKVFSYRKVLDFSSVASTTISPFFYLHKTK